MCCGGIGFRGFQQFNGKIIQTHYCVSELFTRRMRMLTLESDRSWTWDHPSEPGDRLHRHFSFNAGRYTRTGALGSPLRFRKEQTISSPFPVPTTWNVNRLRSTPATGIVVEPSPVWSLAADLPLFAALRI